MEFSVLVSTLEKLEKTSSRTQLTLILVELFKKAEPKVIDKVVYFVQGILWPEWHGLPELGLAEKGIIKAIALATHSSESEVEKLYKRMGDLGKVAEFLKRQKQSKGVIGLTAFMQTKKISKLTIEGVYNTLTRIAQAQGEGSRDLKIKLLTGLVMDAEPNEAKYIVRFVEGRLRLGVGDATIMDALALTYTGTTGTRPIIERAYNIRADLGLVAKILATEGIESLKTLKPQVGIPIRPMLAERASDPREILQKAGGKAIAEFKYDGERAQIHKSKDNIWIFSRRLENITSQYPDVAELARKHIKADEAIVEGEIIAVDPETGELKPFQELMHRKRKHDIHEAMKEYPVYVRLFDCLYVDGEDLTTKPLVIRREWLKKIIDEIEEFRVAEHIFTNNPEELEKFFLKAIEGGCEGLVVKAIHENSIYQAGVRGWLWIKYKRDYRSEMTDTVDLVVVGAFYGRGRRAGKFGALLVAAYNPDTDTFQTVCKVGSGFTDEDLHQMSKMFEPYIIPNKHPRVDSQMVPDVWIRPAIVIEIIGAELTLSPLHTCCKGAVKPGVGISIRFPRFIRWRPDKSPEDATTTSELLEMYLKQLRRVEEK